jgi:hypothetical protein
MSASRTLLPHSQHLRTQKDKQQTFISSAHRLKTRAVTGALKEGILT